MTRGIATPETYYFTRLLTDAARAVEVAADLPGVDRHRIAVSGGGLAAPGTRPGGGSPSARHGECP